MSENSDDWSNVDESNHEDSEDNEVEAVEEVAEASDSDEDELNQDDDDNLDPGYIDECPINETHFDFVKRLGAGAYGTVFLAQKNCGIDIGKIYAIKVISKEEVVKQRKTIVHMRAERKVLELLKGCPYIPNLYYAFQTEQKLFIVLDYVPGGEMFTLLQKNCLEEYHCHFYIAQLIIALEQIHKHGVVYRDIKLENILLGADGHVRLVDFGLCKKLGIRGRTKSFCGTIEYMAPEVIACTGHNLAADWWALGVLTIELLTGVTAFGANESPDGNEIMNRITSSEPFMPPNISKKMEDFIKQMLMKDPLQRLGGNYALATDIKNHPLFDDIDWERLEAKELPAPILPSILNPFDVQNFSDEFTSQPATYEPSAIPEKTFLTFKGYSYIAPDLQEGVVRTIDDNEVEVNPVNDNLIGDILIDDISINDNSVDDNLIDDNSVDDNSINHNSLDENLLDKKVIDENLNSLSVDVFSDRDPTSEFFAKYEFASTQPIGKGTLSTVMKCINLSDNLFYAVKIYKRQDQPDHEIDVLKRCASKKIKGVVELTEVLSDSKWTYLIMELIDGINLLKYFSVNSLNGKTVNVTFNALCKTVKSLHSVQYVHGRICFKNILFIQKSSEIRLVGLGYARPMTESYNRHIDFQSIGVCLYTVLCGHSPFDMLQSSVSKIQETIQGSAFNTTSKNWIGLQIKTRSLIEKLFNGTISSSTFNFRSLNCISSETLEMKINNLEELIDENKRIISLLAIKSNTSSSNGVIYNLVENIQSSDVGVEHISNGIETSINGYDSVESQKIGLLVEPTKRLSLENHSDMKESQNSKQNSRKRKYRQTNYQDLTKQSPNKRISLLPNQLVEQLQSLFQEPGDTNPRIQRPDNTVESNVLLQSELKLERTTSPYDIVADSMKPEIKEIKNEQISESRKPKFENVQTIDTDIASANGRQEPNLLTRPVRITRKPKKLGQLDNSTPPKRTKNRTKKNVSISTNTATETTSTKKAYVDREVQTSNWVYTWPKIRRPPSPGYYCFEKYNYK